MITNQNVFDAFNGSIKKWERLVINPMLPEDGTDDCRLCELFFATQEEGYCLGCPVSEHVKAIQCRKTPYVMWSYDHRTANAEKELKFLKMLKKKHFGDWK